MLKKDKKILETLANKYGVSILKEEIDLSFGDTKRRKINEMARMSEAMLDNWWSNLGFDEMEIASGYVFDDFEREDRYQGEDGYQEFVDVCDEWWGELSYEEKIGVYNEVMR